MMLNVIQMARTVFRDFEIEQLTQCSSKYGHRIERYKTEHHDEYILVFDQWDTVVAHIGILCNGGIFCDGPDYGYAEYSTISALCNERREELKEA
jgi:hypothetical protein